MLPKPKLSIVIPCYNMGEFVEEAMASILSYPNQEDLEIIVVNDGSDDQGYTTSVLESFKAPNLYIHHQENAGLGNARNTGIKLSKTPYVLLLDADNRIMHRYIEEGIEILGNNPNLGVVYGDLVQFGKASGYVSVGEFSIDRIFLKNYIDACVVLRKEAWLSVGGYDEGMPLMGYEDWDLHLRLFFKGWGFQYVSKPCFEYRVRENSMLQNSNKNRDLLVTYMFNKPELYQAKVLRDALVERELLKSTLDRKGIKWASKMESLIKKTLFFRWLKTKKVL